MIKLFKTKYEHTKEGVYCLKSGLCIDYISDHLTKIQEIKNSFIENVNVQDIQWINTYLKNNTKVNNISNVDVQVRKYRKGFECDIFSNHSFIKTLYINTNTFTHFIE